MATTRIDRETLSSYLDEVGHRVGHQLVLDENGVCGLECDDGLTCGVTFLDDTRAGFFSPVLDLGDIDRTDLFEYLLGRNLFSLEPVGACLGFDEDRKQVLFCLPLAAETLNAESFAEHLGRFIKAAGIVKTDITEKIRNLGTENPGVSPDMDNGQQFIRA